MPPRRLALLFAVLLLIAGVLRIGWIAGHQPVLGYANQFDMGRTSACFGLWPDLPEPFRYQAHLEAPIARYVAGEHRPDECYVSSELLFTGLAMATWKIAAESGLAAPDAMDLRYVGGIKAGALVLLALFFAGALRERPAWLLAHAAVFALVLADPIVTLWLNTLYTEFAAVFFGYMAVLCLVLIAGTRPERAGWYLGFGCALLGLGLSRQQHALLPACLLVLAWPFVWHDRRRLALPLAAVACGVLVLQTVGISRPPTIAAANNLNVVLGTLLPAAADEDAALAALDLPAGCATVIGATWYVTMGEDLRTRCPGVAKLPRWRVLGWLATEPAVALRALLKAAPLAQSALLRYVGSDASRPYGSLRDHGSVFARSIATIVERWPPAVWLIALAGALAAFVVLLCAWFAGSLRHGAPPLDATLGSALGGILVYALLTSVFGDGMVEIPRHAHLGLVAWYALVALGIALVATRLGTRWQRRSLILRESATPPSALLPWALLLVVGAVSLSSGTWLAAWQRQPLAIGAVDEPETNVHAAAQVVLHGWTMDPFGPTRAVTVVNGGERIEGHAWPHPTDATGAALARAFPTYRDPAQARFETVIDTSAFGQAPVSVRTYARNEAGVLTEIDRRVLTRRAP